MQHKLLLTLSVAALFAAAPAIASPDTVPAKATIEASAPATTEAPSSTKDAAGQTPAAAPSETDANAMTKTEGTDAVTTAAPSMPEAPGAAPAEHHEAAAAEGHHGPVIPSVKWSFDGPFGTFDRAELQRGFQVYKQVCSACHSMNRVYFRNLAALGYNEAEIKSIAAETQVQDGPNDDGDMFERPGRPSDHFKAPFANDQAARAANGGALPPDLSLIVRARANGANYVHALLTGFGEPPAGFVLNKGMHYNKYFAGHQIAMPQPLMEGSVTYEDGTAATIEQESRDVTTFLTWASEPMMEKRKQVGVKVVLFMLVFAGLMYMTKRKVWKDMH